MPDIEALGLAEGVSRETSLYDTLFNGALKGISVVI